MGGKIEIIWCEMGSSDSGACVLLEKVQDGGRPILQLYYEAEAIIRSHAFNAPFFLPLPRRSAGEIVCLSPPSALGPGPANLSLRIDRANISTNGTVFFRYSPDPVVTAVEPAWSIAK